MTCVRTYRESMAEFSQLKTLEVWYQALDADKLVANIKDPAFRQRALKRLQKERAKSIAEDIFPKLVEHRGEMPVIKDQLPTIFHKKDTPPGKVPNPIMVSLAKYRETLPTAYQSLLNRYEIRDAAIKVVGIGSVGTSCWVLLLWQGKVILFSFRSRKRAPRCWSRTRARASSPITASGSWTATGLMQPASDMFLGWGQGERDRRHYFVRQLRDIKISIRVETFGAPELDLYATWCGKALALSHARSGSSALLSGYMGKSDTFDKAIAAFSLAYADQNESDHAALERAVRKGKVKAVFEEDR